MSFKLNPEIAAAFVDEAKSYLVQILEALRRWAGGDPDALEAPRRLIHTIKGAASMVGLPVLAHGSLLLEETLKSVSAAPAVAGDERPEWIWRALRSFDLYIDGISGSERRDAEMENVIRCLRRVRREPESGDAEAIRLILAKGDPDTAPAAASVPPPELASAPSEETMANFRQDAEDLLLAIGRSLHQMQQRPGDRETLCTMARGVHSLKGASLGVGQQALAELTHGLEDLLDELIAGSKTQTAAITSLIFSIFDTVSDLVTGDLTGDAARHSVHEWKARLAAPAAEAEPELERDTADEVPPEFLEVFRPEAEEHLASIAGGLRELAANPADKTVLQDVRRAVHTLKGAAGVIGMMKVNALAHRMEDVLDAVWDGSITLQPAHQQLLFATSDVLADLICNPDKQTEALARRQDLMRQYEEFSAVPVPAPAVAPAHVEPPPPAAAPVPPSRYVRVPIERLDEMVRLVSELVVSRSTFEQHLASYRHGVDELRLSLSRVQRLNQRFDSGFQLQALLGGIGQSNSHASRSAVPDKRAEFDSLEFDRYTDLHLVSRDLSETASDIGVGVSQLSHVAGDFDAYVNRLGRLTTDVQDRLMRMRMVPVANLATRLHRTVRVAADQLGKQVDLILSGEEIETDKTTLEELAGPLEHLLRNAVDHGIESESLRRNSGKSVRGQVTVKAYHAGTQIVLEVTDDGRGVDVQAIRSRAVEAGLIGELESLRLEEEDIFELLFAPGFSTAAAVTAISGRGVGLDVVKDTVQKLKGTVRVLSHRGIGTTFQLRLPMSLAILRVLMVKARGELYAMPLANVNRILRLEPGQLERLGNRQILRLDGRILPAIHLDESLGGKSRAEDSDAAQSRQPVLIVDVDGELVAVLVDELLLAREVVVKSLGSLVRKVRGITGATILGDGGIVLIVNAHELFETQRTAASGDSRALAMKRTRPQRLSGYDVLVVDDSISVRRVLTNLFQNQSWRPVAARDGLEALEVLQSGGRVDVMLLDMEMPRMDGYELLTLLRGLPQFASLPVIMLTSRAAEKHRKKAFELGATEFLVKPYQDEALLAVIRRVAGRQEAIAG